MNTGFYKDLDTNFSEAYNLAERDFTHDELISLLSNGNIPQKQIAALKLNGINNQKEADILVSNLTGCDGKIREAVALKINQLLSENSDYRKYFNQAEVFADASIDINGNICRLVIDSVAILSTDDEFSAKYLDKLLSFINEAYSELDKFIFRDKKYLINKQLFKLYWALDALRLFINDLDIKTLYPIINRASQEREYTIREKAAQIVINLEASEYDLIKVNLKNDENYYVRHVFESIS